MAGRTIVVPEAIIEDVLIKVDKFIIHEDLYSWLWWGWQSNNHTRHQFLEIVEVFIK